MTLLLGVLAASILGSVHCAAMCSGFVCLYAAKRSGTAVASASTHAAYNAGRLASYVTLGIVAGAIGARVDRVGSLAGISRGATIAAGLLMIAWAMSVFASSAGIRPAGVGGPVWIKRRLGAALAALRDQPPAVRAGATGLLTTLLPCGWLYTFVITAGGAGSPVAGALVMLAFWAGTVPMMLGVGFGVRAIDRSLLRRLPFASAALVLVLGILSIAGRLQPLHGIATHPGHEAVGHVAR